MAFPTTSVLDNFNRSDGDPGSDWTALFSGTKFEIVSNELVFDSSGFFSTHSGYWNSQTYGPDTEVFLDSVTNANEVAVTLYLRVANPDSASWDGYAVGFRYGNVNSQIGVFRYDAGSGTQLGAVITQSTVAGDTMGVEMIDADLNVYVKHSGVWSFIDTRNDGVYSADGYIGVSGTGWTSDTCDNFGGGTVGIAAAAPTARHIFNPIPFL